MPTGWMKLLTHQTTNGPLTECAVANLKQGIALLKLVAPAHPTAWRVWAAAPVELPSGPGLGPRQAGMREGGRMLQNAAL